MRKPNNANDFLQEFVSEFILLSQNGIIFSNTQYSVSLNEILCDAPARSFITCSKGHTGYFACPKCVQEGEFVQHRVVYLETQNTLRTDDIFKNRTHIEHHVGDSILETLPVGMISQIPLDYMHLVCLGVMKRLFQIWLKGDKTVRLCANDIHKVSSQLIAMKSYIPSEFARKPRDVHDIDRWKATEFSQFLLYTGIVILKTVLPPILYKHFLCLSVAIRILLDPQLCVIFNAYANSLLLWFVSHFGTIYGNQYMSYNVCIIFFIWLMMRKCLVP